MNTTVKVRFKVSLQQRNATEHVVTLNNISSHFDMLFLEH